MINNNNNKMPKAKPLPRRIKMRNGDIRAKYKVAQHVIGTGAFGTVRSCTNRKTHEKFAVKSILKKGNAKNSTLLKNEIALVQRIHHHNVVRVVDVIQDKEYIHIVMEECRGGDLFDKIVDGGVQLTEERACEIVGSLMDAMAYLHGRNIVHRDLKAEHIMLSNNDVNTSPVKIIDFGLAIIHNASIDPPMTAFAGSAFTVAPEVIQRSYGIECDLWSVGVITYFLLTQKMPFNASTDKEIFQKITSGNYAYPQWTQTGLSEEAKDFIDRLLVVDPKRRLTAKQALNHLWIRKHNHARLGASMNSGELAMVPAHERAIVPARPPPPRARMSRDPSSRNGMTTRQQQAQPQQPRQQRQHPQESHGGDKNVATARKAPRRSPRPSQARNGAAPHARPASSRRLHHEPAGRVT